MSRKSLLVSMEITAAGRAHNCRYNKRHRLEKGVKRLTIKSDGDEHHYCLACAKAFLAASADRLAALRTEVDALTQPG
jgi:hypothetical protein